MAIRDELDKARGSCTGDVGALVTWGEIVMLAKHTRRLVLAGVAVCAVALPLAGSPAYAATGDVLTFGASTFGQLGNGSISATPRPTPVKVLGNATDVAGGREHTLALAGGRVYAWGADNLGAVGDGGTAFTNVAAPNCSPR
jgi:alpha-tubulin suppressor-like RCC1 family protein